jgi:hypothetical protein
MSNSADVGARQFQSKTDSVPGDACVVVVTIRRMTVAAIAALPLLLTGCLSFRASYPSAWPVRVIEHGAECPDISGRYQDRPVESTISLQWPLPADDHSVRAISGGGGLYDAITSQGLLSRHACSECITELNWLDDAHDALHVVLARADSSTKSRLREDKTLHRSQGDFSCEDGSLAVAPFTTGREVVLEGEIQRGRRVFWLTQDGALVAFEELKRRGHSMFVVPVSATEEDYVRWQRVQ